MNFLTGATNVAGKGSKRLVYQNKKRLQSRDSSLRSHWCRRGDSNPYRDYSPLDPESSASTNSATSAIKTIGQARIITLAYPEP
jgi:hypothetical protein